MGNPFTHYSPAVNTLVILALMLFAATITSIARDRRRARRLAQLEAAAEAAHDAELREVEDREFAERADLHARETAAGNKLVACTWCDGEWYVPEDDHGMFGDNIHYCARCATAVC